MTEHRCEAKTTKGRRCNQKATDCVKVSDGMEYRVCKRHQRNFEKYPGITKPDSTNMNTLNKTAPITKKPILNTKEVLDFAEDATQDSSRSKKKSQKVLGYKSGMVPEGDVRLTANIRGDLHLRLKVEAAQRRTTIGELIEALVEKYL